MSTDTLSTLAGRIDAWVKNRPSDGDLWFDESPVSGADWQAMDEYEWPGVELIEGKIRMSPPPSRNHQESSLSLALILRMHVKQKGLGTVLVAPFEVTIDSNTRLQPDIAWFTNLNDDLPLLVVEILSPSNKSYDRVEKKAIYQKAAIPHYWIVDPMEQTIEAFELQSGAYAEVGGAKGDIFSAPPFPELEIPLAEIFAS